MAKAAAKTKTATIHAVVGSDESEVKRVAAELAAELTPPEAGEFGLEVIDGCADNADQATNRIRSAIEALPEVPFFGGAKLVWLKNVNFLADSRKRSAWLIPSPYVPPRCRRRWKGLKIFWPPTSATTRVFSLVHSPWTS